MNTSQSNGDGAPEEDKVARVLRETLKGDPPASCGRKMTAALEKFRRDLGQHPYVRRLEGRNGKAALRRWAPPVVAAAASVCHALMSDSCASSSVGSASLSPRAFETVINRAEVRRARTRYSFIKIT